MSIVVETTPELSHGGVALNAFLGRVANLDVAVERETAMARLSAIHRQARAEHGFGAMPFITAEQVHGAGIARVDASKPSPQPGMDALITNEPAVCLGIYVADCCAVYVVDPVNRCIGLAHSGKKGTELRIVPEMLSAMEREFGTDPRETIVSLSPCIRPPHYEVDFAAEIVRQCRGMGVVSVIDYGKCTASNPERYYSYRMEKGKTGRMLALLALTAQR